MAKMKFGLDVDVDDVEAAEQTAGYDGPTPPKGLYTCQTKQMKIMLNKHRAPMLYVIAEIAEPKGSPKATYNGYTFYDYQNITDQSAPYVLQQVTVLCGETNARLFLKQGPNLNGKPPTEPGRNNAVDILSIGKRKVMEDGKHKPIKFKGRCALGAKQEGYEQRLELKAYLQPVTDDGDDDDAEEASPAGASAPPPDLEEDDTASTPAADEDAEDDGDDDSEDDSEDDVEDGEAPF